MGTGDILALGFESVSGDRHLFVPTFIVMALWTFCLSLFKCLSCFVNGKKLFPLVNLSVTYHSTLNICLIFWCYVKYVYLSSRNTDDPEISVQSQCQLH